MKKIINLSIMAFVFLFFFLLLSCSRKTPTEAVEPTLTPTDTIVNNTVTETPINTETAIETNTITDTPTDTATDTFTSTDTPTNTETNTPIITDTPTDTATDTFTSTDTPTNTETNTPTITDTLTDTATDTFTSTDTPTNTETNTPTNTFTLTNTSTNTPTNTFTSTNTFTYTKTFTNTPTSTPTDTPTPTWVVLGNRGFSNGTAIYVSLDIDSTGKYVAYMNTSTNQIEVKKYDSGSGNWINAAPAISGNHKYVSLDVYNGDIYIAFADGNNNNKLTVEKCANGSNVWEVVGGTAGFSNDEVKYVSLNVYNGNPRVAYTEKTGAGGLYYANYSYWTGSGWSTENIVTGDSISTSLYSYSSDIVYVAFGTLISGKYIGVVYERWSGGTWNRVYGYVSGNDEISKIVIDKNNPPTVAYIVSADNSIHVKTVDNNNSKWVNVGTTNATGTDVDIYSYSGMYYIAYKDISLNNKITVKRGKMYNQWEVIGNQGFSVGEVNYISLGQISGDTNNPQITVAFQDYTSDANYGATVMKINY